MKITKILLILAACLSLTGCWWDKVTEEAERLQDDVTKAYDNIKEEAEKVSEKVTDTANQIEDKINDVKNAKDAIDKVVN
jgi:uncharacterized coiled-coil DUF342 family protein